MTRRPFWKDDVREALNTGSETWSLSGPNRLVKVVRPEEVINQPDWVRVPGYVTQERFLFNKMPKQIEKALGLQPFSLNRGCRVFRLERLPGIGEYSDELTADRPGGLAFVEADMMEARIRFVTDKSLQVVPYYPPGSPHIPQWRVTVAIRLKFLIDLWPLARYPERSV
jgi:hypothetical protein